jgi:cell division protein FtsI (penicillin-binding protein 3)
MQAVLQQLRIAYLDSLNNADELSEVHPYNYQPVVKTSAEVKNMVPDVRNMTLRDALYVLENKKIRVVIKGKGRVVAQDVLPGTPITNKTTVTILLN